MTGPPVASQFYSRIAGTGDGDGGGTDANASADAETDADADDEKDEAVGGGPGRSTAKSQLRLREVKGCRGDVSYIAYHTKRFATSAAGVARVDAYRYHHLDGCVKAYTNRASGGGPDAPINTVRCSYLTPFLSSRQNLCLPFQSKHSAFPFRVNIVPSLSE
jgi:hypothetical protein